MTIRHTTDGPLSLDLSAYNDPQYGTATGISVDKTSDAGYVLSLTINYGNKSQTFTAENDIRKALGHYQKKVTLKRWLCEGEYVDDTKRLL